MQYENNISKYKVKYFNPKYEIANYMLTENIIEANCLKYASNKFLTNTSDIVRSIQWVHIGCPDYQLVNPTLRKTRATKYIY